MGSVPIHKSKLLIVSGLIELLGILLMMFIDFGDQSNLKWLLLLSGIVFYIIMYSRYRNSDARHTYELETVSNISNLVKEDKFIRHEKGLADSAMEGANNMELEGL